MKMKRPKPNPHVLLVPMGLVPMGLVPMGLVPMGLYRGFLGLLADNTRRPVCNRQT